MIYEILPQGEENAIPATTLYQWAALKGPRELQKQIAKEREDGALILSNGHGYFTPSDGARGQWELQRFIHTLSSRAANTERALGAARAALEAWGGGYLG